MGERLTLILNLAPGIDSDEIIDLFNAELLIRLEEDDGLIVDEPVPGTEQVTPAWEWVFSDRCPECTVLPAGANAERCDGCKTGVHDPETCDDHCIACSTFNDPS